MGQRRQQRLCLSHGGVCGEHDLARRAQLPLQFRRSAEGGQRPFGNDEDLVADGLHLGEDMGAENDSVALSKLLDQISDLDDLNGVKADGRLIQNDDLRICGKCLGDLNHLLLRNRKGTHLSGCIEICIQLFEVFVRLLIHFFPLDHMMFADLMTHKNIFSYCKVRV